MNSCVEFCDAQQDDVVPDGIGGTGLAAGGELNPASSSTTDYLDQDGKPSRARDGELPEHWFYKRVWQITTVSATLKEVTVSATVSRAVANAFAPKAANFVALKSDPFRRRIRRGDAFVSCRPDLYVGAGHL